MLPKLLLGSFLFIFPAFSADTTKAIALSPVLLEEKNAIVRSFSVPPTEWGGQVTQHNVDLLANKIEQTYQAKKRRGAFSLHALYDAIGANLPSGAQMRHFRSDENSIRRLAVARFLNGQFTLQNALYNELSLFGRRQRNQAEKRDRSQALRLLRLLNSQGPTVLGSGKCDCLRGGIEPSITKIMSELVQAAVERSVNAVEVLEVQFVAYGTYALISSQSERNRHFARFQQWVDIVHDQLVGHSRSVYSIWITEIADRLKGKKTSSIERLAAIELYEDLLLNFRSRFYSDNKTETLFTTWLIHLGEHPEEMETLMLKSDDEEIVYALQNYRPKSFWTCLWPFSN